MSARGIVGKRSWIARSLIEFGWLWSSDIVEKSELGSRDFTGFDSLLLVLGRSKCTPEEGATERSQLAAFLANPLARPRRLIYISSMDQTQEHKRECEVMLEESSLASRTCIVRPPAIFGHTQDVNSPMLLPTLARQAAGHMATHLRDPDKTTHFISMSDLCAYLARLMDPENHWDPGQPIPGSFTATPRQIRDIVSAFDEMRRRVEDNTP